MAKITRKSVSDTVNDEVDETEDDQDEMPARTQRPKVVRSAVSSGWGAPREERVETVNSPRLVLNENGTRIIKILDEQPAVKYKRHYINSVRRYYTCPQQDCPLCNLPAPEGRNKLKASWTFVMNVVDMADNPEEVKTWTFGNEVAGKLQSITEDKETTLNDEGAYFEVKHVPVPGRKAPGTDVSFIRSRYIEDEHGLLPLNENDLEELSADLYGAEIVWVVSNDYLENVASDVVKGDFPLATRQKD